MRAALWARAPTPPPDNSVRTGQGLSHIGKVQHRSRDRLQQQRCCLSLQAMPRKGQNGLPRDRGHRTLAWVACKLECHPSRHGRRG
eukprot:9475179-Pyramimonas_sp.AAC.1